VPVQRIFNLQSWLIVLFGFSALSLAFSARAALGLVMPVWRGDFGWSSSFVSGAAASALIVMAAIAPLAGYLVDKRGPRLVLTIGLVAIAVGCALIATTSSRWVFAIAFGGLCATGFGVIATHVVATAVAHAFDRSRGLATGIATSGATGGQFLIVPLIASLLTFASWRWSFAGLAVACTVLIPCVLFTMRRADAHLAASSMGATCFAKDVRIVVTKPAFHILFWSFLICGFTTTGVIETHLLPYAALCGFPPVPSATAYGVLSAVNMIGMIMAGWLADRVDRILLLAVIYGLRGLAFLMLMDIGADIDALFIFAVAFGAVDYATVPVTASLVVSHLGLRVMGLAMGMISAGHSVGGAAGAFLGGYVFDVTRSYDLLWTGSLWLAIGAGALVLLMQWTPHVAAPPPA